MDFLNNLTTNIPKSGQSIRNRSDQILNLVVKRKNLVTLFSPLRFHLGLFLLWFSENFGAGRVRKLDVKESEDKM